MRIKLLWFYLFLTEGLVVYSNLSILLLSILCLKISLKTAVNSICLGTCSSCFFVSINMINMSLEAGAKVQLLFNLASVFWKFFENFRFPFFLPHSPCNQRHHSLNLSKNLFIIAEANLQHLLTTSSFLFGFFYFLFLFAFKKLKTDTLQMIFFC